MGRRLSIAFILILLLAGCGTEDTSDVTPPVVAVADSDPTPAVEAATATVVPEPATPDSVAIVIETDPEEESAADSEEAAATDEPVPTDEPTPTETPFVPTAPAGLSLTALVDGFSRPLYLTHANDGRLFIVQQTGEILVYQNGGVLPTPFLDVGDLITTQGNEQGLLGLAFHPDYQNNGTFYLNYNDRGGSSVVASYQVSADNPNIADPNSGVIMMIVAQPYANHNGGAMAFGPDGYLYISLGDGGSAGDPDDNGQDPTTLLGAILRIDVDNGTPYGVPADNPFVADDSMRNEIWAYGLRNVWRFSFDRLTGDLWMADVGQNEWEEVNWQPAGSPGGENYGWNILEGTNCYAAVNCSNDGFTPPVAEYNHSEGCSVTGGYVYRGTQSPTLQGNYFFADYCSGTIWSLTPLADGSWQRSAFPNPGLLISSFGEGADGELYVIDQAGGTIFRLHE